MIQYFCFYPQCGWPNPQPKLHDRKEDVPQCYLDMSSAGKGDCWVFRAEYTEHGVILSFYHDGRWIEAGAPPTLEDAKQAFQGFIDYLQGDETRTGMNDWEREKR